jgi:hypothetical protein
MQARTIFVLAFAIGCRTMSLMPDMTSANGTDMAMANAQGDMAMGPSQGSSDMAKAKGKTGDMASPADMAKQDASGPQLYTLTVNNTSFWCDVTVTINGTPTEFTDLSKMFMAAASTTVMLKAVPNGSFKPVKWTGVTTMSGNTATYVMTTAANQSIIACCDVMTGPSQC